MLELMLLMYCDGYLVYSAALIKNIKEQGIDVIGMVKNLKQRYLVDHERVSLKELYRLAKPASGNKSILRSIHTIQTNGLPVKIVFARNRN